MDDAIVSLENKMPPHARGTVQMLRARGHVVMLRMIRCGSLRYSVDGARETNALVMPNRYERKYGG